MECIILYNIIYKIILYDIILNYLICISYDIILLFTHADTTTNTHTCICVSNYIYIYICHSKLNISILHHCVS